MASDMFLESLSTLFHNLNLIYRRYAEKELSSHQPIRFVSLVGAESHNRLVFQPYNDRRKAEDCLCCNCVFRGVHLDGADE